MTYSLIHLSASRENHPQAVVRLGKTGIDPDRLFELNDGFVDFSRAGQGHAQTVINLGLLGLNLDGLSEIRDGLLGFLLVGKRQAEMNVRFVIIRIILHGRPEMANRPGKITFFHQCNAGIDLALHNICLRG